MKITARENVILAMEHKKTMWIPNNITDMNIVLQQAVQERYEGGGEGKDVFGVEYQYNREAKGPVVKPGSKLVDDIENWREEIVFPDLESIDWEGAAERDTKNWDRKNKFSIVQLFNGMFERAHIMMGFEDTLCALLTDPEPMMDYFETFTDYRIEMIHKVSQYYKPDAIMIFDDYGAKESMMLSPETWRTFMKPNIQRMVDAAHECGMFFIFHCCGYYKPIFQDVVEMGVDAVHPVQVSNNPVELKKLYGDKICFCGGFDNVGILDKETSTEEDIRREVRRVINELSSEGSFVAWKSYFCVHSEAFMDELNKFIEEDVKLYKKILE